MPTIAPSLMRTFIHTLFVAFFLIVSQSCTTSDQSQGHLLSPKEVISKKQQNPNIQIIDVRTPEEFGAGHVEGAQLINWYDAQFESQINSLNKNQAVIVYCAVGGRSGKAYTKLKQMGFKEVYDLKGGFDAWIADRLPISK